MVLKYFGVCLSNRVVLPQRRWSPSGDGCGSR